jgi:pyridoxal phosphate enzyme (YggS family)
MPAIEAAVDALGGPVMSALLERYAAQRARLDDACRLVGRSPSDVLLLPASKGQPVESVQELANAGCAEFAESYVQEWREKVAAVDVRWHIIGPLQSNKVRELSGQPVALIHTVAREKLVREIAKRCPGASILIQVNVADEASKSGVAAADAPALVSAAIDAGLDVRGFMAMAPLTEDSTAARRTFDGLRELRDATATPGVPLHTLSMGMSGDLEDAVAAGATIVRVGTAIFGPRVQA